MKGAEGWGRCRQAGKQGGVGAQASAACSTPFHGPPCTHLVDLVDASLDPAVQNERDEQRLHLALAHVELLRDEGDAHPRVGLDRAQHHLRGGGGQ